MQTSNEIAAHIEETKQRLKSNVHELEEKVRSAVDWKQRFAATPLPILAVAFGGGVIVAALSRRHSKTVTKYVPTACAVPRPSAAQAFVNNPQVAETWNQIKGALIAVAAKKVTELITQAVPAFADHYSGAPSKHSM